MKLRPQEKSSGDASDNPLHDASWLYSYADLITQMLLFIILMVTALGLKEFDPDIMEKDSVTESKPMSQAQKELEAYIVERGLEGSMQVDKSADRLVIRLESVLLYKLGQAELTTRARMVLGDVAQTIKDRGFNVRVEGHTDDVPIKTAQYPSNWELSTARAIAVIDFFEKQGIRSDRLSAAGYGEYHPIVENTSNENRALNRRVELVILGGMT